MFVGMGKFSTAAVFLGLGRIVEPSITYPGYSIFVEVKLFMGGKF
jgi:hypothetical protein